MSPMIVIPIGCTAPAPRPCRPARDDQHRHAPGQRAQHRAEQEHPDAVVHQRLAAELVGELAVDRHGRGLREQVDREQPRELPEAAEVPHDRRHRGRDDRLVERHERRRQHHRDQDRSPLGAQADVPAVDLGALGVGHARLQQPTPPRGIPLGVSQPEADHERGRADADGLGQPADGLQHPVGGVRRARHGQGQPAVVLPRAAPARASRPGGRAAPGVLQQRLG